MYCCECRGFELLKARKHPAMLSERVPSCPEPWNSWGLDCRRRCMWHKLLVTSAHQRAPQPNTYTHEIAVQDGDGQTIQQRSFKTCSVAAATHSFAPSMQAVPEADVFFLRRNLLINPAQRRSGPGGLRGARQRRRGAGHGGRWHCLQPQSHAARLHPPCCRRPTPSPRRSAGPPPPRPHRNSLQGRYIWWQVWRRHPW